MEQLAEAYYRKTGQHVSVLGGGCADGVSGVLLGRVKMGGLCCPLKPSEKDKLVPYLVARDIKVVIVNPANPVESITKEQLRAIHRGEINNWKQLGWIDKPIAVIYRKHCLDRDEPVRVYLGLDNKLQDLTKKAIVVRTDMELLEYVSAFKTAIAITSKVFTRGKKVKILSLNSIKPTAENVKKGLYDLTGPLYIVVSPSAEEVVKGFINFVLSPEGQAIIDRNLAGVR